MRSRRREPEKGMTIAMVALCIVVFFAMAALAIDLGILYTARTSAQHAADAAALAGAFTFTNSAAPQPDSATQAAIATAAANKILGTSAIVSAGNVIVDTGARRVTVTVPRTSAGGNPVDTFFARVLGHNSSDVSAKATAEAGFQGSASRCVKPIFLPNTILSTTKPPYPNACNANEIIFDANGNITDWAAAQLGSSMKIRPVSPSKALTSSQFYSLDFGSGGNTYRCAWGQCLNYCAGTSEIACGSRYPVETGEMNGPTKQGVDDLVGKPGDRWISVGQYDVNGTTMSTSKSLIVAPVWNNCDPNNQINPGTNGQQVEVIGFLELFVDGMQGQDVQAHLVAPIKCPRNGGGGGGEGNPNPSTGPYAIPVRLVQTQ
jgi:Flp pilus assembly protein TadG